MKFDPRYAIKIFFDIAKTDWVWLTSHPDTDTPAGETVISDVIHELSSVSQRIEPDKGRSTIGSFSFSITDKNAVITEYVRDKLNNDKGLRHKQIEVHKGQAGELFEKYIQVIAPIIDGISNDGVTYFVSCSDINRMVRKDILNPYTTTLSKPVNAYQGHIPVALADTSLFAPILHDASYSDRPLSSVAYARLQDEIFAHEGPFTHPVDGTSLKVFADYTGAHDGAGNAATLTDTSAAWVVDAFIGKELQNVTDGSKGVVTANTATTITAILTGGIDNDWDVSDAYRVITGRGALNTRAAEHSYDTGKAADRQLKITEHTLIEGPAPKVVYQFLTGHVAENLLTYSEDFTNAAWTDPGAEWTVTGNTDVAPDGTTTADTITVTGAGNALLRIVPSPTIAAGGTFTASVWARIKAGTADSIDIDLGNSATPGSTTLTSQWQRITHTAAAHATNNWVDFMIMGASAGATVLLWGAQLSATTAAVPYFKTVATARAKSVLPENLHLGVSHDMVRLSDMYSNRDIWNMFTDEGRHIRFEGMKKTDGKQLIESQIMFWLASFIPIYPTGELGFRRLNPILSDSAYIIELNADNVVSHGQLTNDYKSVVNDMTVNWNYVYAKDDYTKDLHLVDLESIAVNQEGSAATIDLRGVHTATGTDQDLRNYFDSLRDRYSFAPLRINVRVLPSLAWLEVGMVVRLKLGTIRDFSNVTGTTLDRAFEIQQVQIDWRTGAVNLSLFGSSRKAGSLSRTTLSAVLDDAFYNSAGTELSTVLTIAGGIVTADGSLTGGDTMNEGVYYYLGDLTNNSDITISDNVELRIRGHFTNNGTINGVGNGLPGGAGATLWNDTGTTSTTWSIGSNLPKHNAARGVVGGLGTTAAGVDLVVNTRGAGIIVGTSSHYVGDQNAFLSAFVNASVVKSTVSLTYVNLKNNDTSLTGLSEDLRGTSGSGGGAAILRHPLALGNDSFYIMAVGGAGGAGGAGLRIISRGGSFGVVGSINLSGDDGLTGGSWGVYRASSGGGGAPGGFEWFLDGNHTPPDLVTELVSLQGDSPITGQVSPMGGLRAVPAGVGSLYTSIVGFAAFDMNQSAYIVQYIPTYTPIVEETALIPPDVTGLAAVNDGLHARVTWTALANVGALKYRVKLGSTWSTATFLADVDGTEYRHLMSTQETYYFMVAAVDEWGQESQTPASTSVAGAPAVNFDAEVFGTDAYPNASSYFWRSTFDSIDGMTSTAGVTATSGYLLLTGAAAAVSSYKTQIESINGNLTYWGYGISRYKTIVEIAGAASLGGNAILRSGVGGPAGIAEIRFSWNGGTSLIDISLYTDDGSSSETTAITSVTTGTVLIIEVVITPGTSVVATVNGVSVTNSTYVPPAAGHLDGRFLYTSLPTTSTGATMKLYDFYFHQDMQPP